VEITCVYATPQLCTRVASVTQAKYDPLLWHAKLAVVSIRWPSSIVEVDLADDAVG
jgi:hypothetical protein